MFKLTNATNRLTITHYRIH